ncbi:WXG100 family type VII secretion target [Microbacterium lacticum]
MTTLPMQSAAGRLRDGQSELEANLQRLRQLVAQLVQDGFTTTRASGAFDASYTEFTTGATKTVQGIEGMASFLEKAAQALQSTDRNLSRRVRPVGVRRRVGSRWLVAG